MLFTGPQGEKKKKQKQKLTALVVTGAECTLMHGHPQDFSVPLRAMDEYGGQMVSQENHRKKTKKKKFSCLQIFNLCPGKFITY